MGPPTPQANLWGPRGPPTQTPQPGGVWDGPPPGPPRPPPAPGVTPVHCGKLPITNTGRWAVGLGGLRPRGLTVDQAGRPVPVPGGWGTPLGAGGGRWRVAGPGRSDVRRGRELAQVDKAGENRNPRSGGSLAGRGGRLQVGTGPGWGSPAPWGPSPPPGTLALSLRRAPCPPLPLPSRLPPGSSSSLPSRHSLTAATAAPQPPHPVPPPRHPPGPPLTSDGPGTPVP